MFVYPHFHVHYSTINESVTPHIMVNRFCYKTDRLSTGHLKLAKSALTIRLAEHVAKLACKFIRNVLHSPYLLYSSPEAMLASPFIVHSPACSLPCLCESLLRIRQQWFLKKGCFRSQNRGYFYFGLLLTIW